MTPQELEKRLRELRLLMCDRDRVVREKAWREFRELHPQRTPEVVKAMERRMRLE
jgi:hypothetical protein